MPDLQAAKAVTRSFTDSFDSAEIADKLAILQAHTTADYTWRGLHPFNEQPNAQGALDSFWTPLLTSLTSLQRREDVFFAGTNDCDGHDTVWTCSMGHFMGLFDAPWLGIQPTGKIAFLRYAEFHRIEDGKIAETALFCDILHLMQQAGQYPTDHQTAAHFIQPGPRTHDGLLENAQDPAEGKTTLALVNAMASMISSVNTLMNDPDATPPTPQDELAQHWHKDMSWYGPAGIGATYTIERYIEQHQQPFRRELSNRIFNGHVARLAEGKYCGFFGWPNLTVTPTGTYAGLKGKGQPADMRVVDIYRRDGDKLAENWIFIDMLHFFKMQGHDILADLPANR
jgi:predicted ester cyclase